MCARCSKRQDDQTTFCASKFVFLFLGRCKSSSTFMACVIFDDRLIATKMVDSLEDNSLVSNSLAIITKRCIDASSTISKNCRNVNFILTICDAHPHTSLTRAWELSICRLANTKQDVLDFDTIISFFCFRFGYDFNGHDFVSVRPSLETRKLIIAAAAAVAADDVRSLTGKCRKSFSVQAIIG